MHTTLRFPSQAMPRLVALGLAAALVATHDAVAHDGPAHRIAVLNKRMAKTGKTAELLYQRSICYLALRKRKPALIDLEAALTLNPLHQKAVVERVRVLAGLGEDRAALAASRRDNARVRAPSLRFLLAKVTADIHIANGDYRAALTEIDTGERCVPNQPEMLLRRSIVRGWLAQPRLRLRELDRRVHASNPDEVHPILLEEHCDALLAAKEYSRAESAATAGLSRCRFQSRWLIRRARARLGIGDQQGAGRDLMAALRELSRRIHPKAPDLLLLADRATVFHLLGHSDASQRDRRALRAKGYPLLLQLRLQLILEDSRSARSEPIASGSAPKSR